MNIKIKEKTVNNLTISEFKEIICNTDTEIAYYSKTNFKRFSNAIIYFLITFMIGYLVNLNNDLNLILSMIAYWFSIIMNTLDNIVIEKIRKTK